MSEFVVTLDEEKFIVNTLKKKIVEINGENRDIEISRLSEYTYQMLLNNRIFHITVSKLNGNQFSFLIDGHYFESTVRTRLEERAESILNTSDDSNTEFILNSPMPGLIIRINKNKGESVKKGDSLILLEAMKMENEIRSASDGIISEIFVEENKSVEKNQKLLVIKK